MAGASCQGGLTIDPPPEPTAIGVAVRYTRSSTLLTSPAFCAHVGRVMPDYDARRDALKALGPFLER